jgi:hypothetical protein
MISVEVVQQKKKRAVTVQRCHIVETVISQYCRHSSASRVAQYLKFWEPVLVDPAICRRVFKDKGVIQLPTGVFRAKIGTTASYAHFIAGSLDDNHNCATGTLEYVEKPADIKQPRRPLRSRWLKELAKYQTLPVKSGYMMIRWRTAVSWICSKGHMWWSQPAVACPDNLVQLFRGTVQIYAINMTSFVGGLALLEKGGQAAGLELSDSFTLCHLMAYNPLPELF